MQVCQPSYNVVSIIDAGRRGTSIENGVQRDGERERGRERWKGEDKKKGVTDMGRLSTRAALSQRVYLLENKRRDNLGVRWKRLGSCRALEKHQRKRAFLRPEPVSGCGPAEDDYQQVPRYYWCRY